MKSSLYYSVDRVKLKDNPYVYYVGFSELELKTGFLIELFDAWKKGGKQTGPVSDMLKAHGLGLDCVGANFVVDLTRRFLKSGFPIYRPQEQEDPGFSWDDNPLVASGHFAPSGNKTGLVMTDEFQGFLLKKFPEVSVRESIAMSGIDIADVGETRLASIERKIEKKKNVEAVRDEQAGTVIRKEDETYASRLDSNPYVESVSVRANDIVSIKLRDRFYRDSYLLAGAGIETILRTFEIPPILYSDNAKVKLMDQIKQWEPEETDPVQEDERWIEIGFNRINVMNRLIYENFRRFGRIFRFLCIEDKRKLCRWMDALPRDPSGFYTRRRMISLLDIKKSTYYEIIKNEDYGLYGRRKAFQDEEDFKVIKQVAEYKGFEKGLRQIYMLMPRITDRKMSINKIRRIMHKYGMYTTIRVSKSDRKGMRALVDRNRKANILLQQFRLHRPNEVRLTDVTYLDYGYGLRAYGSASIDPVTGKLVAFIVSEYNDLDLAMKTLEEMDKYPVKSQAILHSDQGTLYMTDAFQNAVAERGMIQSMSKRGYCWDNAPQESFNGHFKDECHYRQCRTIEELRAMIDEYSVYYNTERGMWDRGRMTPVEYEEYLSSMSEEDFEVYLSEERSRYEEMKEQAAEKAIKAARENKREAQRYREQKEKEHVE